MDYSAGLYNHMLLIIDENRFNSSVSINYIDYPDTVGVATEKEGEDLVYYAYQNDERGNIEIKKEFDSFPAAVGCAKEMFQYLRAYYCGIINDCAGINSKRMSDERVSSKVTAHVESISKERLTNASKQKQTLAEKLLQQIQRETFGSVFSRVHKKPFHYDDAVFDAHSIVEEKIATIRKDPWRQQIEERERRNKSKKKKHV